MECITELIKKSQGQGIIINRTKMGGGREGVNRVNT